MTIETSYWPSNSATWNTTTSTTWCFTPRTIEAPRKRTIPALPIAIGHAVFFLALALAGWLR